MDEMTELEEMVTDAAPEEAPNNSALNWSKYAYNIAALVIDLATGWTIWQLTFWYYGAFWFGAGAIAFYLHQQNWERDSNNEKQTEMSMTGIIVSVVSMLLMAIAAGGLLVARQTGANINVMISEISVIFVTVSLFGWHSIQLARYYFADDKHRIENAIARAKAQANKKVEIAKAAGAVVAANRRALDEKNNQYKRHGDRGAVDAAYARVENREHKKQQEQPRPPAPSMPVLASDTKQERLDPTDRPPQK